jgi:hypothetical protein
MTDHENEVQGQLGAATELLRDVPPPTDLWRQRLLRDIAAAPAPQTTSRTLAEEPRGHRWSMRPMTAIAAGIVCAVIGAGATATLMQRFTGGGRPIAASTVATQATVGRTAVRFTLEAPNAGRVFLVGDFNGWNPAAIPLRRSADGTWEVEVPLSPGRYAYSFLVDGALATDPDAPRALDDDFGSVNSVVMVKGS